MVSVFTIGPKVRGFKPGRGEGFLRAIKKPHHLFLGRRSKAGGPKSKILRYVKTSTSIKEYFVDKNHNFLPPNPPDLLLGSSAGRIARQRYGGRIGSFPL
jgi:hypothetical protein